MEGTQASPGVVVMGTSRIPAGGMGAWPAAQCEMTVFVEEDLPEVIAFDAYLDEDGVEDAVRAE
jgi:hypothetical protein